MTERWMVKAKKADFKKIAEKFHIDPLTARVIRNRDIVGDEAIEKFMSGTITDLYQPRLLKGVKEAMGIIQNAIRNSKKIRIIGDYDIDGVCATYILVTGLKRLKANVDTYIPDRITDGYGINENLIRHAFEDGIELIITCDNGIAAVKEIALAKELGIQVVVTDHHEISVEIQGDKTMPMLPDADAVINPKQPECQYPFKGLCGAVVAWKFIQALYERYVLPSEEWKDFLEIAAIATVGDVMDLTGENRIIVKEGLKSLKSPANIGLKALLKATELEGKDISAYHIGFVLGPCINASGRLDTAARALDLLMTKDASDAFRLAGDLVAMNESRKALTLIGVEEAMDLVENSSLIEDKVLVLFLPECHESLAGIIAGRIRERYNRPTFVLTKGEEDIKGSGRSIEAYDMYKALTGCKEILEKFGGHPMAAGLSIKENRIPQFRKRINEQCSLTDEELQMKVSIDAPVQIEYFHKKLIEEMTVLEPFGKGSPRPLFAHREVQVINPRVFGKNRNVVQMILRTGSGYEIQGVYFGAGDEFYQYVTSKSILDIVYYPALHSFRGEENLRITIQNYR